MTWYRTLALVILAAIPTSARAQYDMRDILNAHAKRAPSGTTNSSDLVDWNAFNRAGWRAINKGYYDTAEHEFLSAMKTAKRPGLAHTQLLARSYADYAWALQKQGRYADAEPLAKWALIAREAALESDSPAIAQCRNQLATLYYEMGQYNQAEPLLRQAIEGQSKARKPDLSEQARSQTLMGLTLVAQRRYAEAEPSFLEAVRLREKVFGPPNAEIGDALNNLAWTYHEQGKDDEARPLFERALKILERSRYPSDPSIAYTLDGLGQILAKAGDRKTAEDYFLRAIAIWEQQPVNSDPLMLVVLRHYADLLEAEGRSADLVKIKARIAPLRAKLTMVEKHPGSWYRVPGPSSGSDVNVPRITG